MSAPAWRPIVELDRANLHEARLQAHYAVQWLARCARAYVVPRPDDSHTNLGWEDDLSGFVTHPLTNGAQIALRILDLTLSVQAAGDRPSLSLGGCSDDEVRSWLGRVLGSKQLDARKLDEPSPYEMPAHPIAEGGKYTTAKLAPGLRELAAWYANANALLADIRRRLAARELNAPPVRCWPHHFDLDCLISLGGEKTIGTGFSPGDDYYDEPYFYVTLYPEPEGMTLPEMPPIGHTHTHEFLAAIARAGKIIEQKDQGEKTEAFLLGSVEAAIKLLK